MKDFFKASRWIFLRPPALFSLLVFLSLAACSASVKAASSGLTNQATKEPTVAAPTLPPNPSLAATDSETETPLPLPAPLTTTSPAISPAPNATPLVCLHQPGRIEEGSLRDRRLALPLEYRIYLPACYDQQLERRFPVLYLIHGQNYNNDQWDRLGADETADRLISTGVVAPFLIVMPRDRSWTQPTEDPFGVVLVEKLIPWIDSHYRTLPERSDRAIGGLSRGAGWAIHLGLSQWELFGVVGAHSLPVFYTDTAHIRAWLDDIPLISMPRLYLDTGEKDYLIRSTLWFEDILNQKGIPHEWHLYPGYHEEAYWQAHLEEYLRWYAADW